MKRKRIGVVLLVAGVAASVYIARAPAPAGATVRLYHQESSIRAVRTAHGYHIVATTGAIQGR